MPKNRNTYHHIFSYDFPMIFLCFSCNFSAWSQDGDWGPPRAPWARPASLGHEAKCHEPINGHGIVPIGTCVLERAYWIVLIGFFLCNENHRKIIGES